LSLRRSLLLGLVAAVTAVAPGAVGAESTVLTGTVGTATNHDAFQISLRDANGNAVSHLNPGTYTINVTDYSTLHNFDLAGPGVSQATDIDTTGSATWVVTFRNGATYRYQCDAHPTQMHGSFTVGTPPPKLSGRVGPGRTIALTRGKTPVGTLKAGKYRVTVRDLTRADNFHLLGPGVNKKTAVRGRGTVTWTVTFRAGQYRYRSDAHKQLSRKFAVKAAG
jgi:plastocyanin